MKAIKNKKATEGVGMPFATIITFIILFLLLGIIFLWYSGLGSKIIAIIRSILK